MLEHEEIEQARPERSMTIELEDFVELEHIDPVFFDKAYYVAPRRDAAKPYRLLLRTLDRTHRVGIGRFVLRTKPHLVAIRSTDDALVLQTLFFGDEVQAPSEVVHAPDEEVSERELRVAEQLVGMFAASWDPERYADEYRDELLRIITEKAPVASGDGPGRTPERMRAPSTPRVEELMDALQRSVEEAKAGRGERAGGAGPDEARGLRSIAERHVGEPDVFHMGRMLARRCDALVVSLGAFLEKPRAGRLR